MNTLKDKNDNFFIGRLKSVKYALKGVWLLITTEPSIKVQFLIAVLMTILGFIMHLSATEWMAQFLAIGLVLVAESSEAKYR